MRIPAGAGKRRSFETECKITETAMTKDNTSALSRMGLRFFLSTFSLIPLFFQNRIVESLEFFHL